MIETTLSPVLRSAVDVFREHFASTDPGQWGEHAHALFGAMLDATLAGDCGADAEVSRAVLAEMIGEARAAGEAGWLPDDPRVPRVEQKLAAAIEAHATAARRRNEAEARECAERRAAEDAAVEAALAAMREAQAAPDSEEGTESAAVQGMWLAGVRSPHEALPVLLRLAERGDQPAEEALRQLARTHPGRAEVSSLEKLGPMLPAAIARGLVGHAPAYKGAMHLLNLRVVIGARMVPTTDNTAGLAGLEALRLLHRLGALDEGQRDEAADAAWSLGDCPLLGRYAARLAMELDDADHDPGAVA